MLPSHYRGRYTLFILLSLLVHFTVIVVLFWNNDKRDEQAKTEKTVIVTLKKKEEPKKEEPKKEEPKKEEPKKVETKEEELKQAEAKKAEAKQAEAKKAEAKKAEAKKAEAKKAEAKKAEAKKVEAKKAEAKKAEVKKAITQEAAPPYSPYQSTVDVYSQEQESNDSLKSPNELIKYGSMAVLDDREMKRTIIYTRGYDNKYQVRQYEGQIIKESLSDYEKHLTSEAEYIFSFHKPPKKDGKKYYGEISLLLDALGNIAEITLKLPSGSDALDESVYNALVQAKSLKLPNAPLLRKAMITAPLTLNYSDEEMVD